MKLSVIIVTYNSIQLIKDCIDSVFQYNDLPDDELEIIVVDNSPEEEGEKLRLFLEKNYQDRVRFIKNENLGYGHGNNVGIKASTGDILAIMNPDVRLMEPLYQKAFTHFLEDRKIASVGFQQKNGFSDYSYFENPEFFVPVFSSLLLKRANKMQNFNPKKHYLSGAFVFFRKEDFQKIGLYDEAFFMYFEEPDVANRLQKAGKKSIFDPSRSYVHLIEVKDDYNVKLLDIGTESILMYFKKFNFDVKSYLRKRIFELHMYNLFFLLTGNKRRRETAQAYIKTLSTALNEKL